MPSDERKATRLPMSLMNHTNVPNHAGLICDEISSSDSCCIDVSNNLSEGILVLFGVERVVARGVPFKINDMSTLEQVAVLDAPKNNPREAY